MTQRGDTGLESWSGLADRFPTVFAELSVRTGLTMTSPALAREKGRR